MAYVMLKWSWLILCLTAPVAAQDRADVILRGGTIVTLDPAGPQSPTAIAIRDTRIERVGSDRQINQLVGPDTRVIELQGRAVIPGFIEGHGHFLGLGQAKMNLDLTGTNSWQQIVQLAGQAASNTEPGRWIVGRGWHQSKWIEPPPSEVQGYPVYDLLSAATPENPVLLVHASGHMCLANAKAMELAGVNRDTPDPNGGEILRDGDGNPIGAFRENAMGPINGAYARSQARRTDQQKQQDLLTALDLAAQECLRQGVTSFQDAGSSFALVDTLRELVDAERMPVRLWIMVREGNDSLARNLKDYRLIGYGNDHLTVRAIKRSIDGALGTHGAWLLEPYEDLPASRGLNTTSLESLRETAELAAQHGYQLCVHAIGDQANHEVLNVFEATFAGQSKPPDELDWRWRIEHAQHLQPTDIPRFAQLGVIASMQGIHCTSDAAFVAQRLGLRRAQSGAYVWQSLLKSGATVINGTDVPVEPIDPIASFYASVTRKLDNGVAFFPEQSMTREQALISYTRAAAYAGFEEQLKGTITPGKLADLVVLSQDLLTVPEEQIRDTRVDVTIVGGQVLFER